MKFQIFRWQLVTKRGVGWKHRVLPDRHVTRFTNAKGEYG